jgi:primosomal protein N' (replication factor Y)
VPDAEQLSLTPGPRRRAPRPAPAAAAQRPIARVAVDVSLAHLDRPFDYLVPQRLDAVAVPGCRVRVRFSGRLRDGFLLERAETTEHGGAVTFIDRVLSPEPVLDAELLAMCRDVADHWAGSLADVLRLALPPRHARAEAVAARPAPDPPPVPAAGSWQRYTGGSSFVAAIGRGAAVRAVWTALPAPTWPDELATVIQAGLATGGVVAVLPDARDVERVTAALAERVGHDQYVVLRADLGPEERYRRWLALCRGEARAVIGTRAAAFAPVRDLRLVVVWDDGDDSLAEPRAPYPHARDVLLRRAHHGGTAALVGGCSRTAEGAALLESGWARELTAPRAVVRATAPRMETSGADVELDRDAGARGRLPSLALRRVREALATGAPVLVQVPRRGYAPALACAGCRDRARCPACAGPLAATAAAAPVACGWCGRLAVDWRCPACGERRLRATVVGAARTAEELGRAFTGVQVRTSRHPDVLATVPDAPALVVATPGAEPVAAAGYGAALLLDAAAMLARPGLRAAEEALRRWLSAAALVRSAESGGRVVVVADPALAPVSALIRVDPAAHAARELSERVELRLPPAVRVAAVTGAADAVADLAAAWALPPGAEQLGPITDSEGESRLVVRVQRADGPALAAALKAAQAVRSARRPAHPVRVQLDPPDLA